MKTILYITIAATGKLWTIHYNPYKSNGLTFTQSSLQGYGELPEEYSQYPIVDFTTCNKFDFSFSVGEEYSFKPTDSKPLNECTKIWLSNGCTLKNFENI